MSVLKLSDEFLAPYRLGLIKPNFGPVGAVTYYRTYSRKNKTLVNSVGDRFELEGQMEHWVDTCIRVTEGNFNLIPNDPTATKAKMERFFDVMFRMGIIPPGRGLWMMGTKYQQERGGDALNNCWFVAVRPQGYRNMKMYEDFTYAFSSPVDPMPSFPFVFTFDRAMTGGGVGFSVEHHNLEQFPVVSTPVQLKIYLKPDHPDWAYIKSQPEYADRLKNVLTDNLSDLEGYYMYDTHDSRQGWGTSYRELIDAHYTNRKLLKLAFDMSDVRGYGEKIRGFGGTSSGPFPLMVLLSDVNNILNSRLNEKITSVDALDMLNLTGRCVVAGNVRRTALIAAASNDDKGYVDAKNYTLVAPIMEKDENGWTKWVDGKQVRRPYADCVAELGKEKTDELFFMAWAQENHRWASNNSVYTDDRFDNWGFITAGIIANGEPGVINKFLIQNFGRIMDGLQEAIDADAEGVNPCAEITLANGEPCNLVEIVPYICHIMGIDVYEAIELATEYVYRITFAKYEWPITQEIIEKNRRIGVSLTGEQDYFLEKYGHYALAGWKEADANGFREPIFHQEIVDELDSWYHHVVKVNRNHAAALGANPSIKLTTMKPSGSVSKLPGLSAGIHFHYAPYIIQRIRFNELDENLKILEMCGFPIERAQREPNTMVVEFPVKAPNADHVAFQSADNTSLEEQFANQYLFAYAWADNAVSATLTFKYEEQDQIEKLLSWYGQRVKTISLLPYSGHGYVQAPWEPIDKAEYERRVAEIKMWPEQIYETLNTLENIELSEADCIGGACPIK